MGGVFLFNGIYVCTTIERCDEAHRTLRSASCVMSNTDSLGYEGKLAPCMNVSLHKEETFKRQAQLPAIFIKLTAP
jgi:hypothetical protein